MTEEQTTHEAWSEVGRQFQSLGESLAEAFRTAWEDEGNRQQLRDLQTGLEKMANDVAQAASSDELALAGKGFSKQVEGEFKTKNPQLDYTWVNRMEQMVISQEQIEQFLKDGKLAPEGGIK